MICEQGFAVKKIISPATQSLLPTILITGDMMPRTETTPLLGNADLTAIRNVLNNLTEDNTQIIETLTTDQIKEALQIAISEEMIAATQTLLDAKVSYYLFAEEADLFYSDKPTISKTNAIYQKTIEGKQEIISVICPYLAKHDLQILEKLAQAKGHTEIQTLLSNQLARFPSKRCVMM